MSPALLLAKVEEPVDTMDSGVGGVGGDSRIVWGTREVLLSALLVSGVKGALWILRGERREFCDGKDGSLADPLVGLEGCSARMRFATVETSRLRVATRRGEDVAMGELYFSFVANEDEYDEIEDQRD